MIFSRPQIDRVIAAFAMAFGISGGVIAADMDAHQGGARTHSTT